MLIQPSTSLKLLLNQVRHLSLS